MPKGQVNLTRQLKKLLGNAHADINNINLQKNTNILKIIWKSNMICRSKQIISHQSDSDCAII